MTKELHSIHTKAGIAGGGIAALFLALILLCFNYTPAYAEDNVDVYRLWQPFSGEHLYTTDWNEANSLNSNTDWIYEGIAFRTPLDGNEIYRLLNPYSGMHMYTASVDEAMTLDSIGWIDEGVAFRASLAQTDYPVYRAFGYDSHLWTLSQDEVNGLAGNGWVAEGTAFYVTGPSEFLPDDQRKKPPTAEDLFSREWAPRIDRYNAGWPLAGYGDAFARAAYRNGMDPRTAPAIARIESGSGKVPLYKYGAGNCWGWMAPLTNDFESSIYLYCEKFSKAYGSSLTYAGAVKYAGSGSYYYTYLNEVNKI